MRRVVLESATQSIRTKELHAKRAPHFLQLITKNVKR
jgi:hypothetical protein